MPFCHSTFVVDRLVERRYERVRVQAGTFGDQLRQRRWALGLAQKDAARQINVTLATYRSWEVNRSEPSVKYIPWAISFLGYDWRRPPESFGEAVTRARTAQGMSLGNLADLLDLDESTIGDLETNRRVPTEHTKSVIGRWLVAAGGRGVPPKT